MKVTVEKQNSGITLVALVITIIVLLILASVSIATLTGDNGILTQAQEAKETTEEATAIEKVQVEVFRSYGTNEKIDIEKLKTNLKNVEGLDIGGLQGQSNFPITVNVDKYKIDIDVDGNVYINIEE